MPSVADLGYFYTSFPIAYGESEGGYELRVIAVVDNTDVSIPVYIVDTTLQNKGDYYVLYNIITNYAFTLSCSQPCLVVQYARELEVGGDHWETMSSFQAVLTPDTKAATNLIFTVPSSIDHVYSSLPTRASISMIVTYYPVVGLHLNDTNLADLDWQRVDDSWNSYATMEIGRGFYCLYSTVSSERWLMQIVNFHLLFTV